MKLPQAHKDCIWCGRRLINSSVLVDCKAPFGPRPRSDEHIIPENIFGKIITTDVCRCCNQTFGELYDCAIVLDNQVVRAAGLAGVKITDLWPQFEGYQQTPSGRKIMISYRKGTFQPRPELKALNELSVPIINRKVDERNIGHFKARLFEKVRKKGLPLTEAEIKMRIDGLIDNMRNDLSGTYTDAVIDETVKPTYLGNQVFYTRETRPWETQWCLAKIFFELSHALWPKYFLKYYAQPLKYCRKFMEEQHCSADGKQGRGIFPVAEELPESCAVKRHVIEGLVSQTEMSWKITFFGTLRWTFAHEVVKPTLAPPERPWAFKIVNAFAKPGDDAIVTVSPATA